MSKWSFNLNPVSSPLLMGRTKDSKIMDSSTADVKMKEESQLTSEATPIPHSTECTFPPTLYQPQPVPIEKDK